MKGERITEVNITTIEHYLDIVITRSYTQASTQCKIKINTAGNALQLVYSTNFRHLC